MPIGPTFDDVLAAARAGADWAIAILYRDLNPPLLRYLQSQHRDAAEDIASDVWLAAATNLASFHRDEAGFRSWLFTIARRRAIDHGRQRSRRRTDPVSSETFERQGGPGATTPPAAPDPVGPRGA